MPEGQPMKRVPKLEKPPELDPEITQERRAQLRHMVEKTIAEQKQRTDNPDKESNP